MNKLRKSSLYFGLLLMAMVLVGCNSDDAKNAAAEKAEDIVEKEEAKVEAENVSATKMYTDALSREVEIPTNPQRVVALWTVGEILALDVQPVGSTTQLLRFYTDEEKDGIEIVGDSVIGDYEKILSLNPDLIVLYALAKEEEIEQFSKIAPTVTTQFFGEPMESLRDLGEILNKQEEAEDWIKEYNRRVEVAREEVKDLNLQDEKAVVIQLALKNMYLYRSSTFPTIFDAYQFQLSSYQEKLQQDGNFAKEQLSIEILPEFSDVDRIFLIVNDEDSKAAYETLKDSTIWNNLPAVKNNQVYVMHNRFSITDITTLDWALDEVKRLLK
ncbi:ABC transporter substrate-binding protein [Metasolibacillus meyeri]|uniref:ABC transporter substrate-binding protein n=1 Tax=Metasolibacillus meyeri TaxID=1071052 RepID=UPI000D30F98A|nr:ABC transporter substrate-binding protein [Metasolibacillus meyeri]